MTDQIHVTDEELVQATVSPRSVGGQSLYRFEGTITEENVDQFRSECGVQEAAERELQRLGFTVYDSDEDDPTISISGPRSLFQDAFGCRMTMRTKHVSPEREESFFAVEGGPEAQVLEAPSAIQQFVEGLSFAEPPEMFATSVADPTLTESSVGASTGAGDAIEMAGSPESALPPIAPIPSGGYRYLFVPDEVGVLLRAARVHRLGTTGLGIKVAMVDTGHYRHPFFSQHGYRILTTVLGPGASDPKKDNHGHGTGESANIFSTAPDCTLIPVKMAADATGAFNAAVAKKPHVITNSWGYNIDKKPLTKLPAWLKPLEAAVANAVKKGIVVCFSAGNGHYGFPGSHPDVISVGGVHVNYPSLSFEASNYASSFDSRFYPGRHVPDVCGLVGKRPPGGAPLVMLPVQKGASLDFANTGSTKDGWGIFSGTSAACPQVAGVVALILQKKKHTPKKVKEVLVKRAIDIKTGKSYMGDPAEPGWDKATGAGLVDAKWSYISAFGSAVADFMAAPPEVQAEMLASQQIERVTPDMFEDMVETLRSK